MITSIALDCPSIETINIKLNHPTSFKPFFHLSAHKSTYLPGIMIDKCNVPDILYSKSQYLLVQRRPFYTHGVKFTYQRYLIPNLGT